MEKPLMKSHTKQLDINVIAEPVVSDDPYVIAKDNASIVVNKIMTFQTNG
jgi:hypothetical protein